MNNLSLIQKELLEKKLENQKETLKSLEMKISRLSSQKKKTEEAISRLEKTISHYGRKSLGEENFTSSLQENQSTKSFKPGTTDLFN